MVSKKLIIIIIFIPIVLLANVDYNEGSLSSTKDRASPSIPTLIRIFDNAIINTYPSYECDVSFTSIDPDGDVIKYKIQWDTDPQFSPDPDPISKVISFYSSGETAITTIPAQEETIYYWSVQAREQSGPGEWTDWSEVRSFTMDMDIEDDFPYWYQVAGAQFEQDTMTNVDVVGDSVKLIGGQTQGTLTSLPIVFADLFTESSNNKNDWDGVKWTKSSADDYIGVQIEYKDAGIWSLVLDDVIGTTQGYNSIGFFDMTSNFCTVYLTNIGNPVGTEYDTLRIKVLFESYSAKSASDPALLMLGLGNQSSNVTGISTTDEPIIFALHKNQPNPFTNRTEIRYQLPKRSIIDIQVFDLLGRSVVTLLNGVQKPGYYSIQWRGTDKNHKPLPSGVYFLRMEAGDYEGTRKLLLIR